MKRASRLESLGVLVNFISVPGKDHAFEHFAQASDIGVSKLWSTYLAPLFQFPDKAVSLI
jgi:hypothetical protein